MGIRLAWLQKIYISWYGCDESFHYSSAIALLLLLFRSHSLSFINKNGNRLMTNVDSDCF